MSRLSAEERYRSDALFHTLVDTLYHQMAHAQYTPTELREACHLAAVMYESDHIAALVAYRIDIEKW